MVSVTRFRCRALSRRYRFRPAMSFNALDSSPNLQDEIKVRISSCRSYRSALVFIAILLFINAAAFFALQVHASQSDEMSELRIEDHDARTKI